MSTHTTRPASQLDVQAIRRQFPILGANVHDRPLVFLDSAAAAQKPDAGIESMANNMRH